MVAAFQAAEALKILAGHRNAVTRGLLQCDVWAGQHGIVMRDAQPSPRCRACGPARELPTLRCDPAPTPAAKLCGRAAVQVRPASHGEVDLPRLAAHLPSNANPELRSNLLRFAIDGVRFSVFADGRALLFGIEDPEEATTLYARYVGPPA